MGIVVHYTAMRVDARGVANLLKEPPGSKNKSYHLTIGRDGVAVQHVDTARAAYHAGGGEPVAPGHEKYVPGWINGSTIGIALCNLGHAYNSKDDKLLSAYKPKIWRAKHWEPYTTPQMAALNSVIEDLLVKHPTIQWLTGHDDVCFGKSDPGPLFDRQGVCQYTGLPWAMASWEQTSDGWRQRRWNYLWGAEPSQPKQSLISKVRCALAINKEEEIKAA